MHNTSLPISPMLNIFDSSSDSDSFLESCYLCRTHLSHSKDIYIYRFLTSSLTSIFFDNLICTHLFNIVYLLEVTGVSAAWSVEPNTWLWRWWRPLLQERNPPLLLLLLVVRARWKIEREAKEEECRLWCYVVWFWVFIFKN